MVLIEQLLTKSEVSEFRSTLNQVPWQDGKNTAMGMAASVKQNGQADAQNPLVQSLTNRLLAKLGNTPLFLSAALPHKIFPPCFNRYSQSQHYGFHVDAAIMRVPQSSDVLRSDLSMTIFLSEQDEYEGGELIVKTEFGEQRIKQSAGSAILYPSSSLHRVTPVTKGERVAAITWVQSMVTDHPMRSSLYELDQSIQSLSTNQHLQRDELDRLHHVYHNLIRQHAQV